MSAPPNQLTNMVGARLKQNGNYAGILEPKSRCWRLNYANEFHLDITPSIPNLSCSRGGELVPDRLVRIWKATNPKGYRAWFEERSLLLPRMRLREVELRAAKAQIEALPQPAHLKGVLKRIVQLLKRNRDVFFQYRDSSLAPLSIILTTLAAKSYEACVRTVEYDDEFELLLDVVRRMPSFMLRSDANGQPGWYLWNPTTTGENFAEKWNQDERRALAFGEWHQAAVVRFGEMAAAEGLDQLGKRLNESFGSVSLRVLKDLTSDVSFARSAGVLGASSAAGLVIGSGVRVRPNTFFGR